MAMKSKAICNCLDVEEEKAHMPMHRNKKMKTSQRSSYPLPNIPKQLGTNVSNYYSYNTVVIAKTVRLGSINMPAGNNTTNVKSCDEKLQKKGIFAFVRDFLMKPISAIQDLISGE
jgi:hypothetical protein